MNTFITVCMVSLVLFCIINLFFPFVLIFFLLSKSFFSMIQQFIYSLDLPSMETLIALGKQIPLVLACLSSFIIVISFSISGYWLYQDFVEKQRKEGRPHPVEIIITAILGPYGQILVYLYKHILNFKAYYMGKKSTVANPFNKHVFINASIYSIFLFILNESSHNYALKLLVIIIGICIGGMMLFYGICMIGMRLFREYLAKYNGKFVSLFALTITVPQALRGWFLSFPYVKTLIVCYFGCLLGIIFYDCLIEGLPYTFKPILVMFSTAVSLTTLENTCFNISLFLSTYPTSPIATSFMTILNHPHPSVFRRSYVIAVFLAIKNNTYVLTETSKTILTAAGITGVVTFGAVVYSTHFSNIQAEENRALQREEGDKNRAIQREEGDKARIHDLTKTHQEHVDAITKIHQEHVDAITKTHQERLWNNYERDMNYFEKKMDVYEQKLKNWENSWNKREENKPIPPTRPVPPTLYIPAISTGAPVIEPLSAEAQGVVDKFKEIVERSNKGNGGKG